MESNFYVDRLNLFELSNFQINWQLTDMSRHLSAFDGLEWMTRDYSVRLLALQVKQFF